MKSNEVLFLLVLLLGSSICIAEDLPLALQKPEPIKNTPITTTYFYAGDDFVASKGINGIQYYHPDRLGTNRIITDSSGNKIGETKTLPFGEEIQNTKDVRFTFTGKELDSELYYFGARYYNPDLGRFTGVDAVKENHPYAYVENSPLFYVDPDGNDNYIFTGPDFMEQAKSAKEVFEYRTGQTFQIIVVNEMDELENAWKKADITDTSTVLFFLHGDMGQRVWFNSDSKTGLATNQEIMDARRKETGATYEFVDAFFKRNNVPKTVYLYTCEGSRGFYFADDYYHGDGSQLDPRPNIVISLLTSGVQEVYSGPKWMSYTEKDEVLIPKVSEFTSRVFPRGYEWNRYTLDYSHDEPYEPPIRYEYVGKDMWNMYKAYIKSRKN